VLKTNNKSSPPCKSISVFLTRVLPKVSREINQWELKASNCQDYEIKKQALRSLQSKRFHAQGGSFFALYHPDYSVELVSLIVAYQTISDYLDNLCDRTGFQSEAAFRYLHLSMLDALEPGDFRRKNYYRLFPHKKDGGYLDSLVEICRSPIKTFPSYPLVKEKVLQLASLYNDLQVYKHLHPMMRKSRLKRWFKEKGSPYRSCLYWWEFAAASGSTLAIFALLALSTRSSISTEEARQLLEAYFPWVCGLHILLDYYIDQHEDIMEGDFNFAACYASPAEAEERLHHFYKKALEKVSYLPDADFHRTIVKGLLAVYLSDNKAQNPLYRSTIKRLLKSGGKDVTIMYRLCLGLRKVKVL